MTTTTASGDLPEDPDWRFDPDSPPNQFTRRMLGRMSLAHLRMCADHAASPLNEEQQSSFDEAYAEFNQELRERIESSVKSLAPRTDWKLESVDFSTLVPQIDYAFTSNAAYDALSESTRASFERVRRNLAAHLDAAQSISGPATAAGARPAQKHSPEDGGASIGTNLAPEEGGAAGTTRSEASLTVEDITPDELAEKVDEEVDQFVLFKSLLDMQEQNNRLVQEQGEIARSQRDFAARGTVFYVVVGMGSVLSGIATVVGLDEGPKRVISVGLMLLVGLVALAAFYDMRQRQEYTEDDAD